MSASDVDLVTALLVAIALVAPGRRFTMLKAAERRSDRPLGHGVTFNKGTALEMPALRNINLAVPQGQFVTMIGSNGAGKSTLLNIISGELVPDRGRVLLDDTEVTTWPIHRARMIARLFQDPRAGICEQMSILENIAIASGRTSPRRFGFAISKDLRRRAADRLSILGLGLENRLDDRVALLSGGQRQALSP